MIVPDMGCNSIISFRAETDELTDKYFDMFRQANQDIIKTQGNHFFITYDGTLVKKIYNFHHMNDLFKFDQYILADNFGGYSIRIMQPGILKNVRWNEDYDIPEEYRIIYLDVNYI